MRMNWSWASKNRKARGLEQNEVEAKTGRAVRGHCPTVGVPMKRMRWEVPQADLGEQTNAEESGVF